MKNYQEYRISKTFRDNSNNKKEKINNIYDNSDKIIKTEYKCNKINSYFIKESDYNYLHQTSSSLNKIKKSKSSNTKAKNQKKSMKTKLIQVYPRNKISNELILNNNLNYNQIPKRMKSLIDKHKMNIIYQNNFYSENNNNNKISSQINQNYFPQPEPFPKTINNNFNTSNNLKYKKDYSNSKESSIGYSIRSNKREDNNILYLLINLNLGELYNIFISNSISFADLFLLDKNDFSEMKIPIGPRNRILHFLSEYKKYGKKFDFMELSVFLNKYKQLMKIPILMDFNSTESKFDSDNFEEVKDKYKNFNDKTRKKDFLLLNSKSNGSNKELINKININDNNIHKLKQYNSVNYVRKKDETKKDISSQKNKINNYNNIKTSDLNQKQKGIKASLSKPLNKYKNNIINNEILNKKNNFDFLYQKFNDMNKKVDNFQQTYTKIRKYSKYIDNKISEFLAAKKIK